MFKIEHFDEVTVIGNLNGKPDELQRAIEKSLQEEKDLVIDLEGTDIGSSCLGKIVCGYVEAQRKGGTIKLAGIPSRVKDLLMITNLDGNFEVFKTKDQAIASFNSNGNGRKVLRV